MEQIPRKKVIKQNKDDFETFKQILADKGIVIETRVGVRELLKRHVKDVTPGNLLLIVKPKQGTALSNDQLVESIGGRDVVKYCPELDLNYIELERVR